MFPRVLLTALSLAAYSTAICTQSYTVKSGDGCDAIAVANGISSYQIPRLNGDNACLLLTPGQNICLKDSTYDCQPAYTVKTGDTCFAIAQSHGISLSKFIENNPNVGDTNNCSIYPGLSVCVDPDSTNPNPCSRTTRIEAGDTCEAIATRENISIDIIHKLNPDNKCAGLIAFTQICVDGPTNNCASIYVVTGNEGGCTNIAASKGIDFPRLRELNPNIDATCGNIYPGEPLCVASK
ncbi:hypothetical protein AAF712_008050 [Marasmius tenuissimus]|uniref:LysM domain-containing protein n=1 Tax=Marasmius tenuissimus TaxID=585030 RepID=A0ABR2ZTM8_9AGAR